MSMVLAKIAIAALISGTALISGAGQGWLTVLFPQRGTEVRVTYEDRDGSGYLNFSAPDPKHRDVLTGASIVKRFPQPKRSRSE